MMTMKKKRSGKFSSDRISPIEKLHFFQINALNNQKRYWKEEKEINQSNSAISINPLNNHVLFICLSMIMILFVVVVFCSVLLSLLKQLFSLIILLLLWCVFPHCICSCSRRKKFSSLFLLSLSYFSSKQKKKNEGNIEQPSQKIFQRQMCLFSLERKNFLILICFFSF